MKDGRLGHEVAREEHTACHSFRGFPCLFGFGRIRTFNRHTRKCGLVSLFLGRAIDVKSIAAQESAKGCSHGVTGIVIAIEREPEGCGLLATGQQPRNDGCAEVLRLGGADMFRIAKACHQEPLEVEAGRGQDFDQLTLGAREPCCLHRAGDHALGPAVQIRKHIRQVVLELCNA